ncbi:MAG: GAF domain-containing SpoIIE family protein phosphatase [Terrimicrobiaceae bacterium]|nr:GAF domain-containing SpoIIE family protein phosphatase [Terrimicrobiaceae bacterium]
MTTEEEIRSLRASLHLYKGLVEVSGLITSITDYNELLRAVLDVARRVMNAEAASLFLSMDGSTALQLAMATAGESGYVEPKIIVPAGKGIAGWVYEKREPLLIPDAYADPRFYKAADKETGFVTRSILCAPLSSDGHALGVLQVLNPRTKTAFEKEDLEAFVAYADLTAAALEKMRNLERERQQQRTDRDIAIAAEIQRELLSSAVPPVIDGFSFACHNTPAANVGGDFYRVVPVADGGVFFAIADVSGKGISASLLMAQTLSALEFVFAASASPGEALGRLNQSLQERIIRGMFITMLVGKIDRASRSVALASAGHCHPVLLNADGDPSRVPLEGALPLGILPDIAYTDHWITLEPDSWLVAFTDGLSESRSETGTMFDEHLLDAVRGRAGTPGEIVERLVAAEVTHRGRGAPLDDLTILAGGIT